MNKMNATVARCGITCKRVLLGKTGTVKFSSEITIPLSFTAECAENAEASENPSVDWNTLKLCALGDLRVDKSLVFKTVPLLIICN